MTLIGTNKILINTRSTPIGTDELAPRSSEYSLIRHYYSLIALSSFCSDPFIAIVGLATGNMTWETLLIEFEGPLSKGTEPKRVAQSPVIQGSRSKMKWPRVTNQARQGSSLWGKVCERTVLQIFCKQAT